MSDYGENNDFMFECPVCYLSRHANPKQIFASYSRSVGIVEQAAIAHEKETGHRVIIYARIEIPRGEIPRGR